MFTIYKVQFSTNKKWCPWDIYLFFNVSIVFFYVCLYYPEKIHALDSLLLVSIMRATEIIKYLFDLKLIVWQN